MKEKERGKFVVFEGVGGSGKTEQTSFAERWLKERGIPVVVFREPGGTEAGELIRELFFELLDKNLIGPDEQFMLMSSSRRILVRTRIAPILDEGGHVLNDRLHPASGAYQGHAEGGNKRKISDISDIVLGPYKPDAIVFIDVSAETAIKRKGVMVMKGREEEDPFDKRRKEYYQKVVEGYREMAQGNWGGIKWYVIDGEPPIEEVSKKVEEVLKEIFIEELH
jgi:dTMP kinase